MTTRERTVPHEGPMPIEPVGAGSGAVLRGIALHREPRALHRVAPSRLVPLPIHPAEDGAPERGDGGRAAAEPAAAAAPAPFDEGYRAGHAAAEAAHRGGVEDAHRRGREAGFEQGTCDGREQGLAEGRQAAEREARAAVEAAAERLERLDELLSQLPVELARRVEAVEDDLVALCHAVVCRILGDRLVTRDGVAHAVRQAVREARAGSTTAAITAIRVHPRDLECLSGDERLAAWLDPQRTTGAHGVRWVADERVRLGGCIVTSDEGSLDARLETQLGALRELLLRRESAPPAAAPAAAVDTREERRASSEPSPAPERKDGR